MHAYFNLVFFHVTAAVVARVIYLRGTYGICEWALFFAGTMLASWGQVHFTIIESWRGGYTKSNEPLWERGPFAIVRHPYYGGMLIMTFSLAFLVVKRFFQQLLNNQPFDYQSIAPLIVIFAIANFARTIAIQQEQQLLKSHGIIAQQYFDRVRKRFVPFIW